MTRQVFLTLAGQPATTEAATQRIHAWLKVKGISSESLILDNGSGLSRNERISAGQLRQLLLDAWKSTVMPEYMSSLPIAGVDGTLRKRFVDSIVYGRAHLKTGSLEGVRSFAGYVLDNRKQRWVVVFIINDPKASAGNAAVDAFIEWVAAH